MTAPRTPAADASGAAAGTAEATKPVPTITVHRGNATPEEVAALAVIAAALGGDGDQAQRSSRTGWSSGARRITQFAVLGSGWSRR